MNKYICQDTCQDARPGPHPGHRLSNQNLAPQQEVAHDINTPKQLQPSHIFLCLQWPNRYSLC